MFTFSYAHAKCARISYPHKSLYAPPIHLMHTHMRECVYTCTLTPSHTYYQTHTHADTHMCMHTCTLSMCSRCLRPLLPS